MTTFDKKSGMLRYLSYEQVLQREDAQNRLASKQPKQRFHLQATQKGESLAKMAEVVDDMVGNNIRHQQAAEAYGAWANAQMRDPDPGRPPPGPPPGRRRRTPQQPKRGESPDRFRSRTPPPTSSRGDGPKRRPQQRADFDDDDDDEPPPPPPMGVRIKRAVIPPETHNEIHQTRLLAELQRIEQESASANIRARAAEAIAADLRKHQNNNPIKIIERIIHNNNPPPPPPPQAVHIHQLSAKDVAAAVAEAMADTGKDLKDLVATHGNIQAVMRAAVASSSTSAPHAGVQAAPHAPATADAPVVSHLRTKHKFKKSKEVTKRAFREYARAMELDAVEEEPVEDIPQVKKKPIKRILKERKPIKRIPVPANDPRDVAAAVGPPPKPPKSDAEVARAIVRKAAKGSIRADYQEPDIVRKRKADGSPERARRPKPAVSEKAIAKRRVEDVTTAAAALLNAFNKKNGKRDVRIEIEAAKKEAQDIMRASSSGREQRMNWDDAKRNYKRALASAMEETERAVKARTGIDISDLDASIQKRRVK